MAKDSSSKAVKLANALVENIENNLRDKTKS